MFNTESPNATSKPTAESVSSYFEEEELIVVSNREPYSHSYVDSDDETEADGEEGEITVEKPVGGLTLALDPVMKAVEGTWVAWASGDADEAVADASNRVRVPPDDPQYTLKRVPLADDTVDGYYYGFSNQLLWPLCHLERSKAVVDHDHWRQYRRANEAFADAVVEACDEDRTVIWFQDYHLTLAPRAVRRRLSPENVLLQFWHIPWPPWEVFRTCPWAEELLRGLLANDMIGFHIDEYCRNFLDCVSEALDEPVDRTRWSVGERDEQTFVRSLPLGIDAQRMERLATEERPDARWSRWIDRYDISPDRTLAVGVDRLDYTKGISNRLAALERLWETHPEWRERLTFVQKGSESRSRIPEYQRVQRRVREDVERINERFGTDDWTPVVYLVDRIPQSDLVGLYREADVGFVTPLYDGMNLVAKEYVAANVDHEGVLVLSEFAGATDELGDEALLINPYDVEGTTETLLEALTMPTDERRRRMRDLQCSVRSNDVYAWMDQQFQTLQMLPRSRTTDA